MANYEFQSQRWQWILWSTCLLASFVNSAAVTVARGDAALDTNSAAGRPLSSEIVIDTEVDLALVGNIGTCTYARDLGSTCKRPLPQPPGGGVGFWSSCGASFCELAISVGKLGNYERMATELRLLTYVGGSFDALIRARYRLTPTSPLFNLSPSVARTWDWATTTVSLDQIDGLDFESEIIIQLTSYTVLSDFDVLDKVIFKMADRVITTPPPSSTAEVEPSTTTSTTTAPPDPGSQYIVDGQADLAGIGDPGSCEFEERLIDLCKLPSMNTTGAGFWSSCRTNSCDISVNIAKLEDLTGKIPARLDVVGFVSGSAAQILVGYRVLSPAFPLIFLNPTVGPAPDWTTTTFDLSRIADFDRESEIVVRLVSAPPALHVDFLDKIVFTLA